MDPSVHERRLVAGGLVAVAAGALLAIGGAGWIAALAVLGGALCCVRAARAAIGRIAPVGSEPAVDASAPALYGAVAADLVLSTAWEATAWVRRVPALVRAAGEVETALARWRERGWLERPELAHALPPPLEKVSIERIHLRGVGPAELLSFASEFEPGDPEIADAYRAHRANRTAQVLLFRHARGGPRPTLISMHGFGMGRLASDLPWLRLRGWDLVDLHRRLEIDVAYVLLPFHGPRTEGPSGANLFDRHPLFAAAGLSQAVWELRRLTGHLRAQGAPAVGVHGISLGGCIAALHASIDGALASAIPMNPAVDLAAIFWRQLPEARRQEWRAAGLGPERLAEAWSLVAPLRLRPKAPRAARLVIASAGDQISTPDGVRALWSHWDEPAIHWLPGGHLVWRGGSAFGARVHQHLRDTLLAETPPAAPALSRFRS